MKPQIIVCGLGQIGYRIFLVLQQQRIQVAGISDPSLGNESHWEQVPTDDPTIIIGSVRSEATLIAAGIRQAKTLLITCEDDALNLAILTQAKLLNPSIRIVNRLFNTQLGARLDQTMPNHVSMSVSALVAPICAFAAMKRSVIGQLNLLDRVWPVTVEDITPDHLLVGKSLSTLWDNPDRMLLTYEPISKSPNEPANETASKSAGEPTKTSTGLMAAIQSGQRLAVGDRLIWAELQKAKSPKRSFQDFVNNTQQGFRQFRDLSRAMILILLVLLTTIGVAILAYISSNPTTTLIDALYFSVGMITGAGGQEAVVENSTDPVKIFTAVMMLVGAGVIGVFYALLNDYILGTHLQQIWMTTRVPKSGHRIVCGLGGVGFRTLDLLKQLGEDVVALEYDAQGRFVRTARSLNVPVITGDAALSEVLKLANIEKASSLLAVTSNDAVNLEIAITAKSVAPHLPVLVRIHDPQFARQIQQVFEFEWVISPTDLTAPAFAAAAIGGRILGNYTARDGLWLAIATRITPSHPLYGHKLQTAASAEEFTPLYAELDQQLIRGQTLLNMTLTQDVVLYLMMPAHRWEKLGEAKHLD